MEQPQIFWTQILTRSFEKHSNNLELKKSFFFLYIQTIENIYKDRLQYM